MTLTTRKPTGAVPWPLILIEGGEKAGKSWASAVLSASPKVGRTFWIDLGEGAADEYGAIPGADYEIVEHDGSFTALYEAVSEIGAIAADTLKAGGKPIVLVIDSMSAEWDLIKDWATDRAKSSRSNRKKLTEDPNADVRVPMNLWNDANTRHRKLMRLLMTFPGIAVMTARGRDVAAIGDDGQPVEGKKEYKVEAQRTLGADASCWVRLSRDTAPVVVGARSVHNGIRPGVDDPRPMPKDWSLEWLIFEALKCDPATARVRDLVEPRAEAVTPEQIRDEAQQPATTFGRIRELWQEAKRVGYDDVTLINESGGEELLLAMLTRLGTERRSGQAPAAEPERPPLAAAPEDAEPDQDAQQYADQAHGATTLTEVEEIHQKAREAGKIGAFIRSPSSGKTGKLALYIDWKRKQLKDVEAAWQELNDAAGKHRASITDLENDFKIKTGVEMEAATAAQIREFVASLDGAAA